MQGTDCACCPGYTLSCLHATLTSPHVPYVGIRISFGKWTSREDDEEDSIFRTNGEYHAHTPLWGAGRHKISSSYLVSTLGVVQEAKPQSTESDRELYSPERHVFKMFCEAQKRQLKIESTKYIASNILQSISHVPTFHLLHDLQYLPFRFPRAPWARWSGRKYQLLRYQRIVEYHNLLI